MLNSKVAGVINGCWIMGTIQTAEDQSGKWAITNIPKLTNVKGATNYSNVGGSSWAISGNCGNVELAEDFLASTFAGSTELYDKFSLVEQLLHGHQQEILMHMQYRMNFSLVMQCLKE